MKKQDLYDCENQLLITFFFNDIEVNEPEIL